MAIPTPTKRGFFQKKTPLVMVLAISALASAVGSAAQVADNRDQRVAFWFCAVATVGFAIAAIWQALQTRYEDRRTDATESPEDLTACLLVMHRMIKHAKGLADTPDDHPCLRLTFHTVRGEKIIQCVPYIGGGGTGGGAGREFSIRSGVMGVAVMSGEPKSASREHADAANFIEELITKWHMPREEAVKVSQDRFSWLAIPLRDAQKQAMGVVWMDSNSKDFFDDATFNMAIVGSTGVAAWVRTRYPM